MIAPTAITHPDHFLLAGVMGDPITHSRSPKLHNYWLAKYSLTGAYMPLAIAREHLRAALRALPALGFSGCNLTIPHKEAALRIVDNVDPLARRIGARRSPVGAPIPAPSWSSARAAAPGPCWSA
jgi:shikimate 5-dehydrogenase